MGHLWCKKSGPWPLKQMSPGDSSAQHAQTTCVDLGALGKRPLKVYAKAAEMAQKEGSAFEVKCV